MQWALEVAKGPAVLGPGLVKDPRQQKFPPRTYGTHPFLVDCCGAGGYLTFLHILETLGMRVMGLVGVLVHPPYLGLGWTPCVSSFCIFRTWYFRPRGPERNRNPKAASSKQARLGTMVSQFRKLRFPLMMRITCGGTLALWYAWEPGLLPSMYLCWVSTLQ